MFPIKKCSITLLALSVLQACGGGGSSSTASTPAPVTTYTFNFTADIKNDCGQSDPFTDFELLLQDSDWQTLSVHQPDSSGSVSLQTTSSEINYTIVAKSKQGSEPEGYDVVSFANADVSQASKYTASHSELADNDSCICETNDLVLTHNNANELTQVSSSADFSGYEVVDVQNTRFTDVKVCQLADGSWPVHSFMVLANDVNDSAFGAANFLDNFADDGLIDWQVTAFIQANNTEALERNHPALETYQLFGDLIHFPLTIEEDQDDVNMFNSHSYISEAFHVTTAEQIFDTLDGPFGTFTTRSVQIISSEIASESLAASSLASSPDFDENNPTMIESDSSYNYANVASSYPFVEIRYQLDAISPIDSTPMPVTWTMYGPQQGTFPDAAPLTGYEDTISNETSIDSIHVTLFKANTTNRFSDYISAYQAEEELLIDGTFDMLLIEWDPR